MSARHYTGTRRHWYDVEIHVEQIGIVEDVGTAVTNFKKGDKVIISCITSCGKCDYCKQQMYSHCSNGGGWILGHTTNGVQAEYVRIPHADNSLHHIPAGADDSAMVIIIIY